MSEPLVGLLTANEAAVGVGVTAHTIRQWVRDGLLRPYAMQGRTRLYLARDVVEAHQSVRRRVA